MLDHRRTPCTADEDAQQPGHCGDLFEPHSHRLTECRQLHRPGIDTVTSVHACTVRCTQKDLCILSTYIAEELELAGAEAYMLARATISYGMCA